MKKGFDKDSKVKIVKQIFVCFFRAGRYGRLVFYPSQPHMGPIWLLKWSILAFSEKLKSLKLIFKNSWVKNVKIKFLLHTIQRLTQEDYFALWLIIQTRDTVLSHGQSRYSVHDIG